MNMQQNADLQVEAINEKQVVNYLMANPDFFASNIRLLTDLNLPHGPGGTISLIERQVAVLREQNRATRKQLHELIQIANDNDTLINHLYEFTLALMDADRSSEICSLLEETLKKDFKADAAILCLFMTQDDLSVCACHSVFMNVMLLEQADDHLSLFKKALGTGEPVCGKLTEEQLDYLFPGKGNGINSAAQIPLDATAPDGKKITLGVLAIGSCDAARFQSGMGTVFLKQLGTLVGRKLRPYMAASVI